MVIYGTLQVINNLTGGEVPFFARLCGYGIIKKCIYEKIFLHYNRLIISIVRQANGLRLFYC